MTPEQLKASILQYAIQGKLVEQRPEEGTGEELYRRIQEEKRRLVENGKLKKEKSLPEIAEDEIPFEIPENWKWVRLDDIVKKPVKRGKSPTYTQQSGTLVFAQKCNTKAGYINLNLALFLDEQKLDKYPSEEFMQDCDIVINSTGNGTLGRVGMYRDADNPKQLLVVPDSHVTVIRTIQTINVEYVHYVLKHYQPYMEKLGTGSTNQTELSASTVRALLIPLPPLAEQKRIVAKIEELLPYVDRYAAAYEKLEQFNAKFPQDMKKSILQYAIQGKLVEQRPEEGTGEELYRRIQEEKRRLIEKGKLKKEKSLPEIAEDEIPFDIPESWKWVRLGQCGTFVRGSGIKKDEVTPTGLPCVRYGQLYTHYKTKFSSAVSFISEELFQKCQKICPSDILMALTGENNFDIALAVTYEGTEPVAMGGDMTKFTGYNIDPLYFTYAINSPYGIVCKSKLATGNIIVHISNDKLASIPIPLPPFAEQKRIVAKLEEILPLCERLM